MTYSTLLVHLRPNYTNRRVLDVTAALAERNGAKIIGIAASELVLVQASDGYIDGPLATLAQDLVHDELAGAETMFRSHTGIAPFVLDWRSILTLDDLSEVVASNAGCADLIIVGTGPATWNHPTHADTGELVIRAGRPVLVVPDSNVTCDFRSIMVAWSGTRESRRAICDALPLLHMADRVTIVATSRVPAEVVTGMADVVAWLARHGVDADRIVSRPTSSVAEDLGRIVDELAADLIVAGGYGHGPVAEWAFGGITRDLLLRQSRCVLLSH